MNRKTKSTSRTGTRRKKPLQALDPEVLPADSGTETEAETEVETDEPENEDDAEAYSEGPPGAVRKLPVVPEVLDAADTDTDAELRAISPTDPLRRYLEEVRRYPLIDTQKELELALRLRESGDLDAAKALVQANLRLVVKIAFEYRNFYSNVLDLIQEGNIGLMKAVSKFDPTKGARLGYYASWWIRSYILKYLLDNFRLVKVGTTQAQKKLFYHLMREKERLEAQGLLAGPKLLAQKLDVREKDVVEMEHRLSGHGAEVALDAPVNRDGSSGPAHVDLLVDQREGADEQLARQELVSLLHERLPEFERGLDERERKLLHARLLAEEPRTLQEVADEYGLTRERARQIEAKVVAKLREFLATDLEET